MKEVIKMLMMSQYDAEISERRDDGVDDMDEE